MRLYDLCYNTKCTSAVTLPPPYRKPALRLLEHLCLGVRLVYANAVTLPPFLKKNLSLGFLYCSLVDCHSGLANRNL